MLPKYHIVLGALFSLIVFWLFPSIGIYGILLIFFSSFLGDIDHYLIYIFRKRDLNIKRAYRWNYIVMRALEKRAEKTGRRKKHLHIFHTLEFHVLLALLSFLFPFFLFILCAVVFHSIVDFVYLIIERRLQVREYLLTRYLLKGKENYF